MKFIKALILLLVLASILGMIGNTAMADFIPTPVARPTSTPPPSSSGGGGGSSGGSTFSPFVAPLLTSSGTTIGNLTGKTQFSVLLLASNGGTVDGKNYTVTMQSELTQRPPASTRLDMTIMTPDRSGLPKGMNDVNVLGVVNITRYGSYGWTVSAGSIKLTFDLPGVPSGDPGAIYYLVRYDGSSYTIQNAKLDGSDSGVMTLEADPSTDSGLFTVVEASSAISTPTPTPTPLPVTPSSAASPTPVSDNSSSIFGLNTYVVLVVLGAGVFIVAGLFYLLYMRR